MPDAPRPLVLTLERGEHLLCRCGQSEMPPFCDQQADCDPLQLSLPRSRTLWFCRCGRSQAAPYCDGSHSR